MVIRLQSLAAMPRYSTGVAVRQLAGDPETCARMHPPFLDLWPLPSVRRRAADGNCGTKRCFSMEGVRMARPW